MEPPITESGFRHDLHSKTVKGLLNHHQAQEILHIIGFPIHGYAGLGPLIFLEIRVHNSFEIGFKSNAAPGNILLPEPEN